MRERRERTLAEVSADWDGILLNSEKNASFLRFFITGRLREYSLCSELKQCYKEWYVFNNEMEEKNSWIHSNSNANVLVRKQTP